MNTRSRIISTLFAALFCFAFGFTPQAMADLQVPFQAKFTTAFQSTVAYPLVYVEVAGSGNATHLGRTSASSVDQVVDLSTGEVTATYYLTAANGDQLIVKLQVQASFIPGGLQISGEWKVLGGSGRFQNATGGGVLAGEALFTGPDTGVDHFTMAGSISRPRR